MSYKGLGWGAALLGRFNAAWDTEGYELTAEECADAFRAMSVRAPALGVRGEAVEPSAAPDDL